MRVRSQRHDRGQGNVAKGHRRRIVAIDLAEDRIRAAAEAGFIGLLGDATARILLTKACVEKEKAVIVNMHRDDTNILVILTVRHLSKQSKVIAQHPGRGEHQAAAAMVPTLCRPRPGVGGHLLAVRRGTHSTPFLCDLMSTGGQW